LGDAGRGDTDAADDRHRGYNLDHDTSHDYLLRDCAMDREHHYITLRYILVGSGVDEHPTR
jgi:hypothetical protein